MAFDQAYCTKEVAFFTLQKDENFFAQHQHPIYNLDSREVEISPNDTRKKVRFNVTNGFKMENFCRGEMVREGLPTRDGKKIMLMMRFSLPASAPAL